MRVGVADEASVHVEERHAFEAAVGNAKSVGHMVFRSSSHPVRAPRHPPRAEASITAA